VTSPPPGDAHLAYRHLAEVMERELCMKAWAIPAEARRSTATISGVTTIVGK